MPRHAQHGSASISKSWLAALTGILAALMPLAFGGLGDPFVYEGMEGLALNRLMLLLFLAGVLAGAVYWLVAGRSSGAARASSPA